MDTHLLEFNVARNELSQLVGKIRGLGFKEECGQKVMMDEKNALLAHFMRLNRDYCPRLVESSKFNVTLHQTMKIFWADMQILTDELHQFFVFYPEIEHSIEFSQAVGGLYARLAHCVGKQKMIAEMFVSAFESPLYLAKSG